MGKDYRYETQVLLTKNYFKLGLNPTELVLLEYLLFKFQYNKMVWLTEKQKEVIAGNINVSLEELEAAIITLRRKKYIKPSENNINVFIVDEFFYSLICCAPEAACYWTDVLEQSSTNIEAVKKIADKESKELS